MAKKAKRYELGQEEEDSKQASEEKIKASVRRLLVAEVLTDEWLIVAAEVEQLSTFSTMEASFKPPEESGETLGKNAVGTLWDTSKKVDTLRVLVEEAKVNICIRLLKEFRDWSLSQRKNADIESCAVRHSRARQDIELKLDQFEFDLGLLLRRLFEYVEAIQLADMPLLLEYIARVLASIVPESGTQLELRQESQVFTYLKYIFRNLDQMNEQQVLHWLAEFTLTATLFRIVTDLHQCFTAAVRAEILEAVSALAESELFLSRKDTFIPPEAKPKLVKIRNEYIRDMIVETPEKRSVLRPLLELIDRLEREMRFPSRKK